jgi:hypothetical protein
VAKVVVRLRRGTFLELKRKMARSAALTLGTLAHFSHFRHFFFFLFFPFLQPNHMLYNQSCMIFNFHFHTKITTFGVLTGANK